MARPKDPIKIRKIKKYIKKKGKATTYKLGKVIDSDPKVAKNYLDDMIKKNEIFKQKVVENGRVKIYYAFNKKELPKSDKKIQTHKKQKIIVPKYYKVLEQIYKNIIVTKDRKILFDAIKDEGYSIEDIIKLQKKANDIEMDY